MSNLKKGGWAWDPSHLWGGMFRSAGFYRAAGLYILLLLKWRQDDPPFVFMAALSFTWPVLTCPCACVLLVAPASVASWASSVSLEVWMCQPCFLREGTRAHPQGGWGLGCCWPWHRVGLKPACVYLPETGINCYDERWQTQRNAHQRRASASLQKASVSSRLALASALENKCARRGLWVCICCSVLWGLQPFPSSTFTRGQVLSVGFLF